MGWALSRQFSAPESLLSMVDKRPVYRCVSMVSRRMVRLVGGSSRLRSNLDTSKGTVEIVHH